MWRRYLLWFAHEHIDFRHAEMQSILSLFDIPIKYIETPCVEKPYWVVELPSEGCAKKIASRSVLIKNCIELWSKAKSVQQLHTNLQHSLLNTTGKWTGVRSGSDCTDSQICPKELIESCCSPKTTFKIDVETFCKHFSLKEKVEKIETFSYLPLEGQIRLKKPDITLSYLEFYGVDPNNVPEEPYHVFFGRWVADGQRELIKQHSLKKRSFIGNTSMDAQLAILMANQAQVGPGDLVLDPFVGSGSLLIPAAHFGAYVCGSDIDFMMLHARSRPTRVGQKARTSEESICANMRQYGTESKYLDVIVSDFSMPNWREGLHFDAIITDPPYGVREPTERIGGAREGCTLGAEHLASHVPSKVPYSPAQLYADLLHFAARRLPPARRLVLWYPVLRSEYDPSQLPTHPWLALVGNSEQVLSRLTARRLLTYERHAAPAPGPAHPPAPPAHTRDFRAAYFSGEMCRAARRQHKAEVKAANLARRDQLHPPAPAHRDQLHPPPPAHRDQLHPPAPAHT